MYSSATVILCFFLKYAQVCNKMLVFDFFIIKELYQDFSYLFCLKPCLPWKRCLISFARSDTSFVNAASSNTPSPSAGGSAEFADLATAGVLSAAFSVSIPLFNFFLVDEPLARGHCSNAQSELARCPFLFDVVEKKNSNTASSPAIFYVETCVLKSVHCVIM